MRTAPVGETAPAITFDAMAPVPPMRLALKTGSMPAVSKLVKKGSVTWSATGVNPPLRLPIMTSLRTHEENRSLRRRLWPCVPWS